LQLIIIIIIIIIIIKTYWGVELKLSLFTPRVIAPGTHWVEGCPRVGLDAVEKRKILAPSRDLNACHPVRIVSLYRMRYPDSYILNESV
jgi:hypothetical protein